jgi:hypothetical protein
VWQYALKIIISSFVLVAVAETAKRWSFLGALLASLPLTSLLAFVWLYIDTKDVQKVAVLSQDIFWLVIPSLVLFIVLPALIKYGFNFWFSLVMACIATIIAYFGTVKILAMFGTRL